MQDDGDAQVPGGWLKCRSLQDDRPLMLVELIAYVDIRHRDPDVQEKLKPMNVSEADLNDGSNL